MSLEIRRSAAANLTLYAMVYREDAFGTYVLLDDMTNPQWIGLSATDTIEAINDGYAVYLVESDERSGYYEVELTPPTTPPQQLQIEIWEQTGSAPDRSSDLLHVAYETHWSGDEDESESEIHQAIIDIQASVAALAGGSGVRLSQSDRRLLVRLSNQINSIRKSV